MWRSTSRTLDPSTDSRSFRAWLAKAARHALGVRWRPLVPRGRLAGSTDGASDADDAQQHRLAYRAGAVTSCRVRDLPVRTDHHQHPADRLGPHEIGDHIVG